MTNVLERLTDAINGHDIDRLVGCFAPDFTNTWPVHPARGFTGSDKVRANWTMMFDDRPDITATIVNQVTSGEETWGEWEFAGTYAGGDLAGTTWHQRGVIVVAARDDLITEARFYMEPVEEAANPGA